MFPKITRENRTEHTYTAFIKLKDVKGNKVHDTKTVWSCDELELWVDHDVEDRPLGIQVIFTKKCS